MTFIKSIDKRSNDILLYKLEKDFIDNPTLRDRENYINRISPSFNNINICFLDVETTGINIENDKIIEIALKVIKVDKSNGKILLIENEYQSFDDPHQPISMEVSLVNGITNEMVEGHEINWDKVTSILNQADIIVAHNASFDRAFIDRYASISKEKIWSCSINDINWLERGFVKSSQELLCIWHGFYYDSHRAMNDVNALIHLLFHHSYTNNKPIIELIKKSQKPYYKIIAKHSTFDTKDILKTNKYKWDQKNKVWWKFIDYLLIQDEKKWLKDNVYNGPFLGIIEEINLQDKYKS